ncbi:uncharacterized protein LOC131927844 isoform X2 [Physella acuta]|uniref:uncharacterized protein LOC131927844 isoform X2 n=1 Tax=Physella acuta TaxID=109671 RepID=UPI0027DC5B53|nr:uncharacterized protein LOC131927844 isoform X2 [Physella acuta]
MPTLEGMHAPGNENAHLLPPAGYINPIPKEVYRFNRVVPHYPPDPCIHPHEGDVICLPDEPAVMRNHPCMPTAGKDVRMQSDTFRFHKVYPPTDNIPCRSEGNNCVASAPITQSSTCPCTHRCPPLVATKPYDLKYMSPGCADRKPTPHFVTPYFYEPTPFIKWPSTSPYGPSVHRDTCRRPFSIDLLPQCPNSNTTPEPNLAMFLSCYGRPTD